MLSSLYVLRWTAARAPYRRPSCLFFEPTRLEPNIAHHASSESDTVTQTIAPLCAYAIDMVSADNLNLDVLELIFLHLSGNDLPAVALVSRSFFAGVIPRLYRTIPFRIHQAKRYANV